MVQLLLLAFALLFASSGANAAVANYTFTVESMRIKQLCNTSDIIAVNGQLPGPTIEVNEGDAVVVNVINGSPYNLTIHWHGIQQLLTPWADGPSMVTQCPIQPNSSYVYRFNVIGQEGTLWWHAHASSLRATVYGAIIIKPRNGYPFPVPDQEVPVVLGEWWNQNVVDLEKEAVLSGQLPSKSDAFTINGLTGELYPCANEKFTAAVEPNKTVLLRVINAALNTHLFFKVAGHTFTVVAVDACYTAGYATDTLVLGPGNTVDALMVTNAAPSSYYMAVQAYDSVSPSTMSVSDGSTATAVLLYNGTAATATPAMPTMPTGADSATANAFYFGLRGLGAPAVPSQVDVNMAIELGLGQLQCESTQTSCSGNAVAAAMNGVSFRLPTWTSLLEAQFNGTPGVYTADFPAAVPPSGTPMAVGTKVMRLPYNSTVEIVLQNPIASPSENHPVHLHGFNFFVVAQGFGTFTPGNVSGYNLADPVSRNTIPVPTGSWAVIRFVANNPGMWFFHCHLDAHVPIGLAMVFAVDNGATPGSMLPPPPADLPRCDGMGTGRARVEPGPGPVPIPEPVPSPVPGPGPVTSKPIWKAMGRPVSSGVSSPATSLGIVGRSMLLLLLLFFLLR